MGGGKVQRWATGYNSEDEESRTAGWGIQHRSTGLGWESVQALWFWGFRFRTMRRGDEVLLQLRASWCHHPGTWGIPGGAREHGESALDAALRECREELLRGIAGISHNNPERKEGKSSLTSFIRPPIFATFTPLGPAWQINVPA